MRTDRRQPHASRFRLKGNFWSGKAKVKMRFSILAVDDRRTILGQLQQIEGHVRKIQQLVDKDHDRLDVVDQIGAVRSATHALSREIAQAFALHCVRYPEIFASSEDAVEHAMKVIARGSR